MTESAQRPVLFLAFANDRDDRARYLRNVPEELRAVRGRLEKAEAAGLCELVIRPNTTLAEILDVFQDPRYRGRIAVFHYGGHAGGSELVLESAAGAPETAHARGLASFLGNQRGLELVFLNGCSTGPQVEGLLVAGVRAVIATAESVEDEAATRLAERFYAGMASGATIADAWGEAVGAVKAAKGGIPRNVVRVQAGLEPDRWPWDFHVREGAEIVRDWSLPKAAGNPLWGLPELPVRDLPETPYRHLDWYSEEEAEIFFGRSREIRELYDRVAGPADAPILLFCGQSGVGKSSLLAAGLTPYLRETHDVAYVRREREPGLEGTLRGAIGVGSETSLRDAWLAREGASGRPLVVILDQVEEVYTRSGLPGEMDGFVRQLSEIFGVRETRPRGRILLSFRKEWLADLEDVFRRSALPRSKFFLDRLGRVGIIEIVEGPTRSARLRQHYRMSTEPGLPGIIADDLIADPAAPVAPTLAVLLTKMWHQAMARNEEAPRFDLDLYRDYRLTLLEFVDEQLAALRDWDKEVVDSGLALDVLAFHTTPLGTAERRARTELETAYAHRQTILPGFVQRAKALHLLVDDQRLTDRGSGEQGTRLAHDTLAPLVRRRFDESDRPGQRARRILEARAMEWRGKWSGAPLDQSDSATVEAGQDGMRIWTDAEEAIVMASRKAVALREAEATSRVLATAANREPQTDIALLIATEALRHGITLEAVDALWAAVQRPWPRLLRAFTGHDRAVLSVTFSPDGTQMASAGDSTVRLWEVATRQPLGEPLAGHTDWVCSVAFSPDGKRLASAGEDGTVRLWDLTTRQPLGEPLAGGADSIRTVAFSPDGTQLASGGSDGTIRLWDVATGQSLGDGIAGHADCVWSVAFGPDGKRLASASGDGTLRLWDVATRRPVGEPLVGHVDSVRSVTFRPDGKRLASAGADGTVRLWNVATGRPLGGPLFGHNSFLWSVAYSPDGTRLASAGNDGTVRLWNVAKREQIGEPLSGQGAVVASVAFSCDGTLLASAGSDGTIRLWDVATQHPSGEPLGGYEGPVAGVVFSPDGKLLAAASGDDTVRLWDVALRQPLGEPLGGHTDKVMSIAFSPDGTRLASAGSDRTVRLWDVATRHPLGEPLTGHTDWVRSLAFSPDGTQLASAGDSTVRLWDVTTQRPLGDPLGAHTDRVVSVAFSPDGNRLVSGGSEGTIRVWDVATRQPIGKPLAGHVDSVLSVAFNPDGTRLASAGHGGILWLWDVSKRQPLAEVSTGQGTLVSSVTFSPDGTRLASAGSDGTIRLWEVATCRPLGEPLAGHADLVRSVAFSPDGKRLASAGDDGTIRLWEVDIARLACSLAGRNLPLAVWQRLLPSQAYRLTCPDLPPGEGAEQALPGMAGGDPPP